MPNPVNFGSKPFRVSRGLFRDIPALSKILCHGDSWAEVAAVNCRVNLLSIPFIKGHVVNGRTLEEWATHLPSASAMVGLKDEGTLRST
jgi:hypothetical protein